MSKNSKQPISKNKRIDRLVLFIVIPCIFLVIALCILALSIKDKNDVLIQKERMSAYLENKYGEKFIVNNVRVEGSGLGVEGDLYGDAYPVSDSALRFNIWDIGNWQANRSKYLDEYLGARWSQEESAAIKPLLHNIFGYDPNYKIEIYTTQIQDNEIKGAIPDFRTAAKRYKADISIRLRVDSIEKIDSSNTSLHIERVEKILEYLKSLGATPTLSYIGPLNKGGCYLEHRDIDNINSAKDLESCMKASN